jgi:hypothetical protein
MIRGELLFSLPTAIEKAIGQRPHLSTCHRWRLKKANPLETVKVGGRRMTSVEAVSRFIEANTAAADGGDTTVSPSNGQPQASAERIDQELAEAGL